MNIECMLKDRILLTFLSFRQIEIHTDKVRPARLLSDFYQKDEALQIIADQNKNTDQIRRPTADGSEIIPAVTSGPDSMDRSGTGPTGSGRLLLRMMARWRPARAVLDAGACL